MFCAHCGQRIADGAKFCSHCGAAAPTPVAASTSPIEPVAASPSPVEPVPPMVPAPAVPAAAVPPISRAPDVPAASVPPIPPPRPAAPPVTPSAARPAFDTTGSDTGAPRATVDAASLGSTPPHTGGPADPLPRFDAAMAHGIFARVKGILLSPSTEWPLIAAEPKTASDIYLGYVLPLVAIGVLATFLGSTLIGISMPFVGTVRTGIIAAVVTAVLQLVFSFVIVWLISWLVDVLAPTFGGQRDSLRALKVTAYSYTPAWIAGIFHLIPLLGVLAFIAGLYGLYLLYLGLPVLMRCPKDKSIGYTIVTVLCAIVMAVVIGLLSACAIGGLGLLGFGALGKLSSHNGGAADATIAAGALSNIFGGKSDDDRARVGDALSKLERMGRDAERAEKAAQSGGAADPKAAGGAAVDMTTAMNAVGQIMSGGKDIQPVDFHRLKDMLPAQIGGLKRTEASGQSGEAMGIKGSSASAHYGDGANASLNVEIADLGSLSGLAGLAARFDPTMEKETSTGYERTRKINGQLVHERYDRRDRSGEVSIIVNNRFSVTVNGSGVDADALTGALKEIDVAKLATITASK